LNKLNKQLKEEFSLNKEFLQSSNVKLKKQVQEIEQKEKLCLKYKQEIENKQLQYPNEELPLLEHKHEGDLMENELNDIKNLQLTIIKMENEIRENEEIFNDDNLKQNEKIQNLESECNSLLKDLNNLNNTNNIGKKIKKQEKDLLKKNKFPENLINLQQIQNIHLKDEKEEERILGDNIFQTISITEPEEILFDPNAQINNLNTYGFNRNKINLKIKTLPNVLQQEKYKKLRIHSASYTSDNKRKPFKTIVFHNSKDI
jgi:hypothetical protein